MASGGNLDILESKITAVRFGVYDLKLATVFCLVLSAMLWWIPIFGPAVAGYVCGRKSGSMIKSMICAAVAGLSLLAIVWLLSCVLLTSGTSASECAAGMSGIYGMIGSYLQTFYIEGTYRLNFSSLGMVVVFAGVGGILARQIRMETANLLATGATEGSIRPVARSVELYIKNKELGFECFNDCIVNQNMSVNDNPETKQSIPKNGSIFTSRRDNKPVTTTVQTVTSTVSGNTFTGTEEEHSPFADILGRSDNRGKEESRERK